MNEFPYGPCQCVGRGCNTCHETPGPAAFEVTRDGKRIRVCTKCDLTSDKNHTTLVQPSDDLEMFKSYDLLGGIVLANKVGRFDVVKPGEFAKGVVDGFDAIIKRHPRGGAV